MRFRNSGCGFYQIEEWEILCEVRDGIVKHGPAGALLRFLRELLGTTGVFVDHDPQVSCFWLPFHRVCIYGASTGHIEGAQCRLSEVMLERASQIGEPLRIIEVEPLEEPVPEKEIPIEEPEPVDPVKEPA